MHDLFISKIRIEKCRHLENVDIVLSNSEKKHLILTGKNGSGKTSVLEQLNRCLFLNSSKWDTEEISMSYDKITAFFGRSSLAFALPFWSPFHRFNDKEDLKFERHLLLYLPAYRKLQVNIPRAIEKVNLDNDPSSSVFIQYMLDLNYQRTNALANGDTMEAIKVAKWFDMFKSLLREIYSSPELDLIHDPKKDYNFRISMPGREVFSFTEMADGYSSFLHIVMELIMRMESKASMTYDIPGIVLIDEIESHLHVELQRRVLPFLTEMFPRIQFIVTTHSPHVVTSLKNAVVFDLEKRQKLENPWMYSAETVVEAFLDSTVYSEELNQYFERYKELCFKQRTPEENEEFLRAKTELELMAPASKELYIAFQELEHKRKAVKHGKID